MTSEGFKAITLPDRDEMLRRLTSVKNQRHVVDGLYPLLLEHAGEPKTGDGIVLMFVLAIADYTNGMPPAVTGVLYLRMPTFVRALVDDEEVLKDALAGIKAAGIA